MEYNGVKGNDKDSSQHIKAWYIEDQTDERLKQLISWVTRRKLNHLINYQGYFLIDNKTCHIFDSFRARLDESEFHSQKKVICYGIPPVPYAPADISKLIMNASLDAISELKNIIGASHGNIDVCNVVLIYSGPLISSVKLVGAVDVEGRTSMKQERQLYLHLIPLE